MSSQVIDERVVEMKFNNSNFERNAKASINTVEQLKQNLNFAEVEKNVVSFEKAMNSFKMDGLYNAVDAVSVKFDAMTVAAITAMQRITNKAIDTGKEIVSALTIKPISTGFQEYETQINAVQTILANTEHQGTNLQQVNDALDELNKYADLTIYNFTQMTKNIGTFTAAGVDLQTSVDSIKGIANLAAVSGSTSQQASTAMYQLSQALAAGRVSLQDWNSVVNAGMGGKVFQNALIRTSEVMQTGAQAAIDTYGSFRESLTKGQWLTTEVLTETLKQFAGAYSEADLIQKGFTEEQAKEIAKMAVTATEAATKVKTLTQLWDTLQEAAQSGWTQTWEILIGDFEEAKALFTEVSDVVSDMINKSATARNELLEAAFGDNNWKQFMSSLKEIGVEEDAFSEAFKATAKKYGIAIDEMIEREGSLENVIRNHEWGATVKETLEGMTTSAGEASGEIADLTSKFEEYQKVVNDVMNGVYGNGAERIKKLTDAGYNYEDIQKLVNKQYYEGSISINDLSDAELANIGATKEQISVLKALEEQAEKTGVPLEVLLSDLSKPSGRELLVDSLRNGLIGMKTVLETLQNAWNEVFPPATADQLYAIAEKINEFSKSLVLTEEQTERLKNVLVGVFSFLDTGLYIIKNVAGAVYDLAFNVLDLDSILIKGVETIAGWGVSLRKTVKEGTTFASVYGKVREIVSSIVETFSKFKGFDISPITNGLKKVAEQVKTYFGDIIENLGGFDLSIGSISLAGIGVLITQVISAIKELVTAPVRNLSIFTNKITGTFGDIREVLIQWQTTLKADILKSIAISIGIVAASILVLSSIDGDKISSALGAITVAMSELIGALAIMSKIGGGTFKMTAVAPVLISLSAAVLILSVALRTISSLNMEQLGAGLLGITVLIGELTGAALLMSNFAKRFTKGATGLILFSAAIAILAKSVQILASLDNASFAQGLGGITILIGELTATAIIMGNTTKRFTKGATGLILFSAAIAILAGVVKSLSALNFKEFNTGLTAVTVLIAELVGSTVIMGQFSKGWNKGAAGLVLFSAAIAILAGVVKNLASMKISEMGVGLLGITVLIGELTAAAVIMGQFSSGFLTASVSAIAFAAAIAVLAKACVTLGQLDSGSLAQGLGSITILLTEMAVALNFMKGTIGGSAALLIASAALAVFVPALALLGSLPISVIITGLVAMGAAFVTMGVAGLLLSPLVPVLIALSGVMIAMSASSAILGAGFFLVGAGLSAMAVGLASLTSALIQNLGVLLVSLLDTIATAAPSLGNALIALFQMGFDVIKTLIPGIVDTVLSVILETLNALTNYVPDIVDSILNLLIGIIDVLAEKIGPLIESVTNLVATLFTATFDSFFNLDPDTLFKMISGMGIIAALILALNALSGLVIPAMVTAIDITAFIAELGLLLAALGGLAQIPGLMWLIDEGGKFLQGIGSAIGNLVGGLIGGIAEGISADMPNIGKNLSEFMINLEPFLDGVNRLDAASLQSISMLADAILTLTAAEVLNGLASFFGGKKNTLEEFGKELAAFGPYMKQYSDSVQGIDTQAVENSALATKALSEAAKNLPKDPDSLAGWFAGTITLTQFGEELKTFGPAMKAYSDSIQGLDGEAVEKSAIATKALSEAAANLPKDPNTVAGWWSGTITLTQFAEELKSFAPAINSFSQEVKGIDGNAVTAAANAAKVMADVATNLPEKDGTIKSWWSGNITLSDFAKELEDFGPSLKKFADSVDGISPDTVSKAASAVNQLSEAKVNLGQNGGSLTDFGKELSNFGDELAKFAADINDSTTSELVQLYKTAGGNVVKGFAEGIDDNLYLVEASSTKIGEVAINATKEALDIHSPSGKFAAIANFTIQGYVEEMNRGQSTIKQTMANFSDVIVGSVDVASITKSMRNLGMSVSDIMANEMFSGLSGKDLKVETEAYNNELDAMNAHLDELKKNLSEIKKAKGEESDEYAAANAEIKAYNKQIDKFKENFNDYKKQQQDWDKFIDSEKLKEGQREFDNLIADYKAGRVLQSDFDKKYTDLLAKYTDQQVDLLEYSSEQMKAYVEGELGTVLNTFETKISDIQSKMDSTKDNLNKSFADQYKFKTNQDAYDEVIKQYDDATEKLNKDLEYEKRLHGENSRQARLYQRQLDDLARDKEKFDKEWKESGKDNAEIIDVETTDAWVKQTEKSLQAIDALKTLQERNISQDMIDYLGTLDADSMRILATEWASMTDQELQVIQDQYRAMKSANDDLSQILYGDQVLEAEEQFVYDYVEELNKLPDAAKAIGMEIVQNLTNPFSEETNATIKAFKGSGEDMIYSIQDIFGITYGGPKPKSEEGAEIGNALGNGVVDGTVNTIQSRATEMVNAILDIFDSINFGGVSTKIISSLFKAISGQNVDLTGVVSLVGSSKQATFTDLIGNSKNLNSGNTIQMARTVNSNMNNRTTTRRNQGTDNQTDTNSNTTQQNFSFVQNNYSPDPIDRLGVLRDTKQLFSLARSKFSK